MEAMECILTRRSVRAFTEEPVVKQDIEKLLAAAMSGPSCVNARDWSFVVVTDRALLDKMAEANGRPAEPLKHAPLGILVCGDLQRAFSGAPDYWIIDGAIAAQNVCLAAHALGLGAVWLGTYPQMERVQRQSALLGLPETLVPHSLIAIGHPDPEHDRPAREKPAPEADRVLWLGENDK